VASVGFEIALFDLGSSKPKMRSMGKAVIKTLMLSTGDLQKRSNEKRALQPIKKVIWALPRAFEISARGMKRRVNLVLRGRRYGLDKNLVEAFSLTH